MVPDLHSALRALPALLLVACGSAPNRPLSERPSASLPAADAGRDGSLQAASGRGDSAPVSGGPVSGGPVSGGPVSGDIVAWVMGQPISAAELLEAWLIRDSLAVRSTLEELIESRMVLAEVAQLGVELEPDTIQAALAKVRGRLEDNVRQSGTGLEVEEFIRRRLALNPQRYMQRLEQETKIDLFAERVVRAWLLASVRAEVRVIILDKREDVDVVQAKLARGEDFAALAGLYSVDDSAAVGGRVPPVVRGPSALARLAFSTPVGEVGGPTLVNEQWLFLTVDARPTPLKGRWSEVGPAVQASLAQRAIEEHEYWQWQAYVAQRYEVDMSPLYELVGDTIAK